MQILEIEINPRIHLGLISMHSGAPRKNGGLGFAIQGPTANLTIGTAPEFQISDNRRLPMNLEEIESLRLRLIEIRSQLQLPKATSTVITGEFLTHHGMGSGTAIRLASIEGLLALNERPYSTQELIRLSGRGGTSGVGISTYFDGGFVFDLGVPTGKSLEFAPSSIVTSAPSPLQLCRQPAPNWPLGLCLPRKCRPKTQQEEVEFFRRVTPLLAENSHEATYVALFEILSSLMEGDYHSFCSGVDRMQKCEWKRLERAEYSVQLEAADSALRHLGVDCVGMSSLGPMLFFFASPDTLQRVWEHRDHVDSDIILTSPQNSGRRLVWL
ncbi:beta-ribofuranosylaminobenzene 5'-phosphate synthase family protein [Rhizobium redzepovicii]